MKQVLVFKTSVVKRKHVRMLKKSLNILMDVSGKWNFDLEDCDNILRVETQRLSATTISKLLRHKGFICEELH